LKYTLQLLFISILFIVVPVNVSAAIDWESYADKIVKKGSPEEEKLKKAKKKAKKQEDKFKKILDKEFESAFKKVFNGHIKPSETYDLLKVLEAASAGDYKVAGEGGADLLLAKFVPLVGTYITIMKATSAVIKDQINTWSEEVYYSRTYKMAKRIFMEESRKDPSYVPSYIMTYARNNKLIGKELEIVWKSMKKREDWMYSVWSSDYEHDIDMFLYDHLSGVKSIKDILNRGWASRLRAIRGKDLQQRHVFNHFLHHFVSEKKIYYFSELQYEYIEPLMQKAIKKQKKAMELAAAKAIERVLQKMQQLKEVEEEKVPKKKKILFIEAAGDENSFRRDMQDERYANAKEDDYKANISKNEAINQRITDSKKFRDDMDELAGSLKEVQTVMIIAQAEEDKANEIAYNQRVEDKKKQFKFDNESKENFYKPPVKTGFPNLNPYPGNLQSGSTTQKKIEYKPVGIENSDSQNVIQKKEVSKPKKKKKLIICGYDVSPNSKWLLERDAPPYFTVHSKSMLGKRSKHSYSYSSNACEKYTTDNHLGAGVFERISYKNGKVQTRGKSMYNKKGEIVYVIEFKSFWPNGKLRRLTLDDNKDHRMMTTKKWDKNGKLIRTEYFTNKGYED